MYNKSKVDVPLEYIYFIYPISNECTADVDGNDLRFSFEYDSATGKLGYLDSNGDFCPFSSGGTDVSDTTATASTVRSGYYFYNAQGERTLGTYTGIDTSDATAYAKNIEFGYTAYARGSKITGTAVIPHGLTKYGSTISNLSIGRAMLAGANVGNNYALFAGGWKSVSPARVSNIDIYNTSLTNVGTRGLPEGTYDLAGAGTEYWAIFAGGDVDNSYSNLMTNRGTAINASLSGQRITLTYYKKYLSATSVGQYVLFGGGYGSVRSDTASGGVQLKNDVDAFNSSLTKTIATTLSPASNIENGKQYIATASIGNYAIFAGGQSYKRNSNYDRYSGGIDGVDAYNTSLVKTTPSPLSAGRWNMPSATVGNYALFGRGSINSSYEGSVVNNVVDTYNTLLTRSTATSFPSTPNVNGIGASTNDYALFVLNTTVITYNTSLTRSTTVDTTKSRYIRDSASASFGPYALFAGGYDETIGGYTNTIEAYYSN